MATNKISEDEKRWRAEEDARTLKRALEIKADKQRMKAVKTHCEKEAKALSTVANMDKKKKVK
jgi:hypothetical protein